MKVLFIPQWYPTSITPNAGAFNLEIARAISKIAEVDVLTVHFNESLKFGKFEIKKRDSFLEEIEYHTGVSPIPKTTFIIIKHIYKKIILNYLSKNEKPDIIHSQDVTSYFVLKVINELQLDIPVVVSQHWSIFFNKKIGRSLRMKYKYIFKNASYILPANKNASQDYQKFGLKGNIKWLPNSIDIEIFKPSPNVKREKWILHISGFTKVKNVEDVIHSFKKVHEQYKEYKLFLIGDGPNRDYYEELASNELATNSFEFLGYLSKSEIAAYLQKSCCFVFPSSYETFGVVLIEAAATACPIITTKTGGIPFVLKDDEAQFVEVGDVENITKSILQIIKGKSNIHYNDISANIRKKFSEENMGIRLNTIYKEAIS